MAAPRAARRPAARRQARADCAMRCKAGCSARRAACSRSAARHFAPRLKRARQAPAPRSAATRWGSASSRRLDPAALAADPLRAADDRLRGRARAGASARDEPQPARSGSACDRWCPTTSVRAACSTTSRAAARLTTAGLLSRTRRFASHNGRMAGGRAGMHTSVRSCRCEAEGVRERCRLGTDESAAGSCGPAAVFTGALAAPLRRRGEKATIAVVAVPASAP